VPQAIKLIASDVDGTLLNSQQLLTPRVKAAITAAYDRGVLTIVATGKARGPWTADILPQLPPGPGVFMQGLLVCDVDGQVIYERALEDEIVQQCIAMAEQWDLTLTAYCGQRIFAAELDEHTNRLLFYAEPTPEGAYRCSSAWTCSAHSLKEFMPKLNTSMLCHLVEPTLACLSAATAHFDLQCRPCEA
jgi:hydroxymethylpyrimidine pyrophosphatase-like HAD family hydrolase